MIVELGTFESYQTKGTQATDEAINQILNYCVTHPNAQIHFFASDMYLYEHSDASYISKSEARSRAGGYLFLIYKPRSHINEKKTYSPSDNGALHVLSSIIKSVLSCPTKAKLGYLFFIPRMPHPFVSCSNKWTIPKDPLLFKLTTSAHPESPTTL